MASTRPTRRSSRKPSPSVRKRETTDAAGRDGPITIPSSQPEKPVPAVMPQETANPVKQTFLDQWIEPPLRTPAPSFQDYKGLERQGVLLNMQPLGAMPPAKLTAKTKTDSSNRVSKSKNKKAKKAKKRKGARNGVSTNGTTVQTTPDPVVTPARRSVSTKAEDRASKTPSGTRGTMLEQLITSKTPTKSPVKPSIAPSPSQSLLSGRASNGKAGIDAVVTKAIEKATAAGQDTLVLALQKLYADSQEDASFTELLEAVLTQTANITQVADFQKYMKVARALSKSNASKANHSRPSSAEETTPGSMESSKKSTQRILLRMGADPRKTPVEKERDIKARPVEAETAATNDSSHDGMVSQPNKAPKMKKGPKKGVPTVRIPNPRDGVQTRASSASMSRSSSNQSSSALSSVGSVGPEQALAVGSRSSSTLTRKNKMVPISKTANGPITTNGADASDASSISNQLHRHPPSHSSRSSPITQPATAATTASGTTTTTTNHTASKRSSTNAGLDTADVENGAAVETSRKRPRKTKSFGGYAVEDSFVRSVAESDLATATATTTKSAVRPKRLLDGTFKGVTGDASNQSGVPSASNVGDDGSGPATAELDSASRPGTPHASGRPAKKAKKTPRVKMSPIKKKSGTIAGIARSAHRQQHSPVGNGPPPDSDDDDNNDFCSACGGNGDLLCCDGCDRSFHFTCVDPPMDKDHLPETWFCFVCAAKQDTLAKRSGRLFAVMLFNLEKKNPVAFNLPVRIREYFEGVKTGEEGEYQDALVHKTRTRVGYDEAPDHLKLRDGKGELIVCFACRKSALDHRPIITCDYCNLHWHLDCLDPPMANPPLRNTIHGKKRHWMCPNHTEHELLNNGKAWDMGTSAHPKIRRPKRAKIVEPAVGRGFRNNGIIEIENDVSDGDYNFVDEEHFGTIYRLPEKGIKLDFIDSVKQKNARARDAAIKAAKDEQARSQTSGRSAKKLKTKSGDVTTALGGRSSADQEAALSLAQFAGANHDLGLSSSRVEGLIQTLISEAPTDMDLTTTGTTDDRSASVGGNDPLSPPASDPARGEGSPSLSEREHLMKLAELIRRRLGTST